ncbi:hypothetical protein MKW98_019760 [Papaver atlanticum]|uniref:SWIM-type domain-containing protein n=1 Tax=Papaver atlanticum TaxID=357466 RepID=A0AAD4XWW7_9MAGN|nr:hypothetical protein MKW98_019760 [Papaver atlanticum]
MNDLLRYYPTKGGYVVGKSARDEHPNMGKMPDYRPEEDLDFLPILDPKKTCTKAIQVESSTSENQASTIVDPNEVMSQLDDEDIFACMYNESNSENEAVNKLFVGKQWLSKEHCRDYLKGLALDLNHSIVQVRNKKKQQEYKCKDETCPWRVYFSVLSDKQTFECKKGHFIYTCDAIHGLKHPLANARWVSKVMLESFKAHPNYKTMDFMTEVKKNHKVEISYYTAWHAYHLCNEKILGSYEEGRLPVCKLVQKFHLLMMRIFYGRGQVGKKMPDDEVVPRVTLIVNKHLYFSHEFTTQPSYVNIWQVFDTKKDISWLVNLEQHTCTCNSWQVCGIPCVHAICASLRARPNSYKK